MEPPRHRDLVAKRSPSRRGTVDAMTSTDLREPLLVARPSHAPARDAWRDVRVVAPGVAPFGVLLGVTLSAYGEHPAAVLAGAAAVYGGSAQLATSTVLHSGAGVASAVGAGVVVGARLLLYGAALEPRFRGQPSWFRWLGPAFVLDQTYVSAALRPEYRGASFRRYWGAMGLLLLLVWLAAVGVGLVAAPLLPDLPHLVLVGAAMFLAMLVPRLVDRPAVTAAVVGGVVSAVAALLVPALAVLAGTLTGVVAATLVRRRQRP
jgi:predicted branched-subunit amino acid permease